MPSVNDYSAEDEDSGGLDDGYSPAQAAAIGTATGGAKEAPREPASTQGYIPWSSFVSANEDVSKREADKLSGKVRGDVAKAQGELGAAQESYDTGLEGNYSLGGGQGGGQAASDWAPPPEEASPPGETDRHSVKKQPAAPAVDETATSNPWEPFLDSEPTAHGDAAPDELPKGTRQATDPVQVNRHSTQKGSVADASDPWASLLGGGPQGALGTASDPGITGAWSSSAAQPAATTGGGVFGSSRGAGARSHADELAASAAPASGGPAQLNMDPLRLGAGAAGGKPGGAKDLEGAAGQQAWSKLLGDTLKAQQEAHALGSEAGVQGLLQQQATSPMGDTAFDARLINGQGHQDFQALSKQYGGDQLWKDVVGGEQDSQEQWKKLQGDIAARQAMDAGPDPLPESERPFTPGAPEVTDGPPVDPNADTSGWNEGDDASFRAAYEQGAQAALANDGVVVTSFRSGDPGPGVNRGEFGANKPTINVWGKNNNKADQALHWWGGAMGPPVGDKSIDANTWYALAFLTTEQRAKWWSHNHPGGK